MFPKGSDYWTFTLKKAFGSVPRGIGKVKDPAAGTALVWIGCQLVGARLVVFSVTTSPAMVVVR